MATPKSAKAKKKPKVEGDKPRFTRCSFTPKKPTFTAHTQGLEHIIFDSTGTAKAASTFNHNIEAQLENIANRLKYDSPLAALAVRELKAPTIVFHPDPRDMTNIFETKNGKGTSTMPTTKRSGGPKTIKKYTTS